MQPKCELGTDCSDCGGTPTRLTAEYARDRPFTTLRGLGVDFFVRRSRTEPPFLLAVTDPAADVDVSRVFRDSGVVEKGESLVAHKVFSQCCRRQNGSPGLFVDVGANFGAWPRDVPRRHGSCHRPFISSAGYYAMMAAAHGCRVEAFEPVPTNFAFLRYNVELNGFQDRVRIHQLAISDAPGSVKIKYIKPGAKARDGTPLNWGAASVFSPLAASEGDLETIEVPAKCVRCR